MGYKILMTLNGLDIGGAETHVAELALELHRRGYEVLLASNGGSYVSELEAAGLRHFQVPMNRRSLGAMCESRKRLIRIVEEEHPDIVHAHARIPGYLCGQLQKEYQFPFVATAHWVFQTGFILNRLTNWGEHTLAVSEDIKAYLMENYGIPENRITVTVNGIDTHKFSPETDGAAAAQELGLDPGRPILGTVSRLDPDRSMVAGQLIELAPRLAEEIPGLQILIVGGGGDYAALSERAEAQNRAIGSACICMTGPRTDIHRMNALCDGFVGVSRAALEAMSSAKPVILAGNEGYEGIFTPDGYETAKASNFCCRNAPLPEDEVLFRDIVTLLRMDAEARSRLGVFGREVILRDYSVSRMADDCEQVYRRFLSGNS